MANNYGKKVVEVKKEKTEVMFKVGTDGDIPQVLNPIREIKKFGKTYRVYNRKEYQEVITKLKETLNVMDGIIIGNNKNLDTK